MPKKGYITPSSFKKIMTTTRGGSGFGQTALTYADEVVLDILGVERNELYTASLTHGIENESLAIDRYTEETLNAVVSVEEPIVHSDFDFIAGTPDGLIGSDGIVEIKCPFNPVNHLGNLRWKTNPEETQISEYWWQIQGYLWITDRKYCDFVSFDPRFPYDKQITIKRIERDQSEIDKLSERCIEFWKIIQSKLLL